MILRELIKLPKPYLEELVKTGKNKDLIDTVNQQLQKYEDVPEL